MFHVSDMKLIIYGDTNTGKTSFFSSVAHNLPLVNDRPKSDHVEFANHCVKALGKKIVVQIWDTPGDASIRRLGYNYARFSKGIMIFYDITSYDSFIEAKKIYNEIVAQTSLSIEISKNNNNMKNNFKPVLFVGNKTDLENDRKVAKSEVQKFCEENDNSFIEISVKKKENLNLAVLQLLLRIAENQQQPQAKVPKQQQPQNIPSLHIATNEQQMENVANSNANPLSHFEEKSQNKLIGKEKRKKSMPLNRKCDNLFNSTFFFSRKI